MYERHARALLDSCLAGRPWDHADLRPLLAAGAERALFGVLAEGLSDRFEPALVERYVEIFSEVIAAARPQWRAAELRERYRRARQIRSFEGPGPETVVLLSRVTLGADVAVTSVLLDALKRRFPLARILLAGSRKSHELFAADPRIGHLEVSYGGTVEQRLTALPWLDEPGTLVVDPDSRLSQLGLLPVCPEERYLLFESRTYGAGGGDSLTALARRWALQVFGIEQATPYLAPLPEPAARGGIAVSLGVGENPAKRLPEPFEERLLAHLAALGLPLLVDSGGAPEEAARVRRAVERSGAQATILQGSFASFAATVSASRLYVGYDSAGQHVAAAAGVPLVSIFAGAPCERFFQRWRPSGAGPVEVIRAGADALTAAVAAVRRMLA